MREITYLNWGLGVQSTALIMMIIHGDIDCDVDVVIHADTGYERSGSLETKREVLKYIRSAGIEFAEVRSPLAGDCVNILPFYVKPKGMLNRQCTRELKIRPINRQVRKLLGMPEKGRPGRGFAAEALIGISLDEWKRMKTNSASFITNRYPLVENKIDRRACISYLKECGVCVPVKSACVVCPFRSDDTWIEMKNEHNGDFDKAVVSDYLNGDGRKGSDGLYLWKGLMRLDKAVFKKRKKGWVQNNLFPGVACDGGYCFV